MRRLFFVVLAVFVFAPVALRADDVSGLLQSFEGEWQAEGEAFGAPAQSQMVWSPALGGKFQRIEYRIEMSRENGQATFEGVGYYQLGDGETLNAFWSDNSGDLHPIRAERAGDALISHWGVEGGKQGRTQYELISLNELQVTDWIKTTDGWRQFNQALFQRAEHRP